MSAGDEIFTGNNNNKNLMSDCVFSVFSNFDQYTNLVKWIVQMNLFCFQTGEYFFSLKKYKIPHKTSDKSAKFDVNNPPPPGTEDEEQLKTDGDSYVSPLAAVKRPTQPKFEISVKPIEKPDDVQILLDSLPKPTKRSALFSKFVNNTKP